MTDTPKPKNSPNKAALIALVGGATAALVTPMVQGFEGKRNDPYRDIVGVLTVCYGDTKNVTGRQTDAQCTDRLYRQITAHAKPVLECVPELKDKPGPFAASISLAYNIGPSGFCHSSVARKFRAGDIRGACDGFMAWNRAGGRVVQGLTNRRAKERAICLGGQP